MLFLFVSVLFVFSCVCCVSSVSVFFCYGGLLNASRLGTFGRPERSNGHRSAGDGLDNLLEALMGQRLRAGLHTSKVSKQIKQVKQSSKQASKQPLN